MPDGTELGAADVIDPPKRGRKVRNLLDFTHYMTLLWSTLPYFYNSFNLLYFILHRSDILKFYLTLHQYTVIDR